MNQKIDTKLGIVVIIIIVITTGVFVWKYKEDKSASFRNPNQFNEVNNANKENAIKISDKWVLISRGNFWNNPNLFANRNYNFPNIEFSYPDNWEFQCCNDIDQASVHTIYSSKNRDKSLPFIRIIDYKLSGCPDFKNNCSIDKIIKLTADEKFNRLTSSISVDKTLAKKELVNLNTNAFAYDKMEENDKSSEAYIINVGSGVIEIDFVNYKLLDDSFIDDFLNRISFEDNRRVENVSFCGKNFKTNKVILGDIDIVKRVAIISQNRKNKICENISVNSPEGVFSSSITKQKSTDIDYEDGIYFASISVLNFKIDMNTNNIYIIGAFDGEPTLLGTLK